MAFKQKSPISILEGGTNTQTFVHAFGVAYYDGGALNNIDPGTSGYVLTSNGNGGPASFQVVSASGSITTINGNSGSITPTAGVVTINGGTTGLTTSGSASTMSLTGILIPANGGTGSSNAGTSGQILIGDGTKYVSSAPTSGTGITVGLGAGTMTVSTSALLTAGTSSGTASVSSNSISFVGATGISTSASGSTVTITGTATSITLAGNTGSIAGSSFTLSGSGVLSSAASGSTVAFTSTAANVIHSSSGDATASSNAFTIVGSGTVSTSASGSTLTITGGPAGFTWNNTTGSTQAMVVANGYVDNGSGTPTVYTLPTTAAVGSLVAVQGAGTGLYTIAQNASQTISFNAVTSTSGVGGSVSSTSRYDSITLICITANNGWAVNSSVGNFNVV